VIERQPDEASGRNYDLIVVGGGVYGIALSLEAARRGIRPLLIERQDFGGATSWNSLRIVHGGLRYLQTLDFHRFKESVGERRWLLKCFPDQVIPLQCLMPLYGNGFHRRSVLKIALALNDLLSNSRNRGVSPDRGIPGGRVVSRAETVRLFPQADRHSLQGAALWCDAAMPDSQRLLIEMLHWATACGAVFLNYMKAVAISVGGERVEGLTARDLTTNELLDFSAPVVVNCGGPWCREIAESFDRDVPELFQSSLAFNVLIDREPLSDLALAVGGSRSGTRTYFLVPWKGRILAGTFHEKSSATRDRAEVPDELIVRFLNDLNRAVPGFDLQPKEILRVHSGLLPVLAQGTLKLARREVLVNHAERGGPAGLFSVSGVKFTTARLVAEKTLRLVCRTRGRSLSPVQSESRPRPRSWLPASQFETLLAHDSSEAARHAADLVGQESVVLLDDLLLRRTDWGVLPRQGERIASRLERLLDLPCRGVTRLEAVGKNDTL